MSNIIICILLVTYSKFPIYRIDKLLFLDVDWLPLPPSLILICQSKVR